MRVALKAVSREIAFKRINCLSYHLAKFQEHPLKLDALKTYFPVHPGHLGQSGCPKHMGHPAHKEHQGHLGYLGHLGHPGHQGYKGHPGHLGLQGHPGH